MGITASAQLELSWLADQSVLPGGFYRVFGDGGGGTVDYDTPIDPVPIPAWPDLAGKWGLGRGRLGAGRLGYGEGGCGLGQGLLGAGLLGKGSLSRSHVTAPLADGRHLLAVVPYDAAGNRAASGHVEVAGYVAGEPAPPASLLADSYDVPTDELALTFALSGDDET